MSRRTLLRRGIPTGLLLLLVFLSVERIPAGRVGVRYSRLGPARVGLLGPGWHVRIPWIEVIQEYPYPAVPVEGTVSGTSREGIPVLLPFRFSLRTSPSLLLDPRNGEIPPRLEVAADSALTASLTDRIRELGVLELLATVGREDLERAAGAVLGTLGLEQGTLQIGPIRVPGDLERVLLEQARIRDRLNPAVRILLIGWDGADWGIIDPLIEQGKLPHLAGLKREGAWGNTRSGSPTLSPLLWTTVATGKPPEEHGIVDFLVRDPETGRQVPISRRFRRVKALWNIFTDVGLSSTWIAWWATWPAERIQGFMVTDRVAYSLFPGLSRDAPIRGLTFPEGLFSEFRAEIRNPEDIPAERAGRFVDMSREEIREVWEGKSSEGASTHYAHPVQHLRQILSSTETYHRLALRILESHPMPNLFAIYYQGIDEVCHRFAHFLPPRMEEMVSEEEFSRYRDTVLRFYAYQDELLGELLENVPPDTYVLLLSDHGFAHGSGRPRHLSPSIEGRPGMWHTPNGIYLFRGPGVPPGRRKPATLYQIAPTILTLAGLPVAADLPGRPLEGTPRTEDRPWGTEGQPEIRTYERIGSSLDKDMGGSTVREPGLQAMDAEILEKLRSLGYIEGSETPPASGFTPEAGTTLYHSNLAVLFMQRGRFEESRREYEKALDLQPESIPALAGLSELAVREGDPAAGLQWARRAIEAGLDVDPEFYLWTAELFVATGHAEDGRDYFRDLMENRQGISEIAVALGRQFSALGEWEEAERSYRLGLEQEPACLACLQELFEVLDRSDRLPELEEPIRQALSLGVRGILPWNWLGLIHKRQGRYRQAEEAFRIALEEFPDHPGALANLGSLFLEEGRYAEAVTVLEQGLEGGGGTREVMVNLLLALGKTGRIGEAETRFREAESRGYRGKELYNAMAYGYSQNRVPQRAREMARRSLELDPDQPAVRDLLRKLNGSGSGDDSRTTDRREGKGGP